MMRKFWRFICTVVVVFAVSLCFFGIRVRVLPRLVLGGAIRSTISQLESRFASSPAHLLADVWNPEGYQQAELQLETEHKYLGLVRYDMEVQTQLDPLRIQGMGTVVTLGRVLDISVYMDKDFAALSSDSLVKGNYYGITYDTFSQDIRSWDLLAGALGESMISQWENDVSRLEKRMSTELKLPEFTLEDIPVALYAVLALEPQVGKQEIELSGEKVKAYAISFQASGQEIAEAAEPYREKLTRQLCAWIDEMKDDPNYQLEAVFYLVDGALVQLDGKLVSSAGSTCVSVCLGTAVETGTLTLETETRAGGTVDRISLSLDNSVNTQTYQGNIALTWTHNNTKSTYALNHSYDLSSGEITLHVQKDDQKADVRMHLAGEGDQLTVTTQDIAPLLNLFREKEMESPAICTLTIRSGEAIVKPEYRNLDQWSVDDLWTLLKGLGGLLGLDMS